MSRVALLAPVVRVELTDDRGAVTRRGRCVVQRGRVTIAVESVSPVIVDRTLNCRCLDGGGTVVDARILRTARVDGGDRPDHVAQLEEAFHELGLKTARYQRERDILAMELKAEQEVYARTLADLSEDVAFGLGDDNAWAAALDKMVSPSRDAVDRLGQLEQAIDDCREMVSDLREKLAAIASAEIDMRAVIEMDLAVPDGEGDAVDIDVEISYVVPCACWRPHYTAVLFAEEGMMRLSCDGTVWQHTGEAWTDAELVFSSERSVLGVSPAILTSDVLDIERTTELVTVETRETAVVKCGLGRGVVISTLPGIDDGGESVRLSGRGRWTVPSNGKPQRIPIHTFESEAETALRLFAEVDPNPLLLARATNRSSFPLLPGPVDLVRDNGVIGRGELKYTAPGERLELGFGPDDGVRVVREREMLNEDAKLLSAWTVTPYRVRLYLSNLWAEPKTVAVRERVLVSEIDKIRVRVDAQKSTDNAQPDENGFVDWTVTLPPHGTRELTLFFELKIHDEVVGFAI